jgi:hypothetical protein
MSELQSTLEDIMAHLGTAFDWAKREAIVRAPEEDKQNIVNRLEDRYLDCVATFTPWNSRK